MPHTSRVKHFLLDNVLGFPPPQFLRMPGVGVNISDHSIKVVGMEMHNGGYFPTLITQRKLPKEAMSKGKVKNKEPVAQTLSSLKDEYGLQFIHLSIPEEQGYIFSVEIPKMEKEEIHDAVGVRLPEHVPLSEEDVAFSCEVTEEDEATDMMQVNVSVLPLKVVNKYVDVSTEAGLIPLSLEIEMQSILRAIMPEDSKGTVMVIDMGKTRTGLSIVDGGFVRYTATLDIGGDTLTNAIKQSQDLDTKEAEKIKREQGFIRDDSEETHTSLVNCVSALLDEVKRRFDYWESHSDKPGHTGNEIEKIIMCGGAAPTPGLAEHLSRSIGVPVERANVWENAFSMEEYVPDISFEESLKFAPAIGLALSDKI